MKKKDISSATLSENENQGSNKANWSPADKSIERSSGKPDFVLDNQEMMTTLYSLNEKIDKLSGAVNPLSHVFTLSEKLDATLAATDILNAKIDAVATATNSLAHFFALSEKVDAALAATDVLNAKIDTVSAVISPLAHFFTLSEKLDATLFAVNSLVSDRSQQQHVIAEIDRLDGYIEYHVDKLRKLIEAKTSVIYSSSGIDAIIRTGSFDIVVPSLETGLISYLIGHGTESIEPAVRAALQRHIKAGDVVVDAGTNIGIHSVVMAYAVGEHGRFFGFEALSRLADTIRKTLNLNGLTKQSKIIHAALVDKVCKLKFYEADHSPNSSIYGLAEDLAEPTTVRGVALDSEIDANLHVDLIKIDIEGAEPLAWQGMSRIISSNPDLIIIMEWSASHFERSGKSSTEFMHQIRECGFYCWRLDDELPNQPARIDLEKVSTLEGVNLLLSRNSFLYA